MAYWQWFGDSQSITSWVSQWICLFWCHKQSFSSHFVKTRSLAFSLHKGHFLRLPTDNRQNFRSVKWYCFLQIAPTHYWWHPLRWFFPFTMFHSSREMLQLHALEWSRAIDRKVSGTQLGIHLLVALWLNQYQIKPRSYFFNWLEIVFLVEIT